MTTQERVYRDAQKACGLKVGDYVRILKRPEDDFVGPPYWTHDHEQTIGMVGRICSMTDYGLLVCEIGGTFYFPYFVLEKVEKPKHEFKPFERVLVRDFQTEWMPHIFRSYNPNGTPYQTIDGNIFDYCIPYEGNEHLVGKTEEPKE